MRKPLPPVFVNERARIEEHDRFMAEARRRYGTAKICPDCYLPPSRCGHLAYAPSNKPKPHPRRGT